MRAHLAVTLFGMVVLTQCSRKIPCRPRCTSRFFCQTVGGASPVAGQRVRLDTPPVSLYLPVVRARGPLMAFQRVKLMARETTVMWG